MPQSAFEGPNDGHGNQLQDPPTADPTATTDGPSEDTQPKVKTADEPPLI